MENHRSENTALFEKIAANISKNGPLSLASYIDLVLGDAHHGYYQTRDPFGVAGDFITAPEISGLFGEMCGLYLAHIWESSGLLDPAIFELGPGRGSLMADMRHVWQHVMPPLTEAPLHLLETSSAMRCIQQRQLSDVTPFWHRDLENLPAQPIIAIANEFFDALPIFQAINRQSSSNTGGVWHHRLVGLVNGQLEFVDGPPLSLHEKRNWALEITQTRAPDQFRKKNVSNDAIVEYCPLAAAYAGKMAQHLVAFGGACLIIDYGSDGKSGNSLQAVANHQPVDVFYKPGNADLSHWVDFNAIRRTVEKAGGRLIGPVTQGEFLSSIGIIQRTEAAAKLANAKTRRKLFAAVDRLVSSKQMGSAFKVALILPPGTGSPPGFVTKVGASKL